MGDKTGIEWTDATWNPVTGCDKVSPGCDHCYAETFAERWRGTEGHYFANGFDVQLRPDKLALPLRWTKPRKVFVNSMSDLFHDKVPDEYIAKVFAVMLLAQRHTFQVLTKRHGRMRSLLNSHAFWTRVLYEALDDELPAGDCDGWQLSLHYLPNVWLGVSTEDQQWADIRIPALLDTPAAVRWISAEPLLGPIDLTRRQFDSDGFELTYWLTGRPYWGKPEPQPCPNGGTIEMSALEIGPRLDWVVVGGESGPGARPMHPDWARSLRDQCAGAGVPFLFKQWGEWLGVLTPEYDLREPQAWVSKATGAVADEENAMAIGGDWTGMWRLGKKRAGRELDGRTWDQYPEAVR